MAVNVPAPTFLHGFTIEAWFNSPTTGRTCDTQQGWMVTHPAFPKGHRVGENRAPELGWKSSLAKAVKEIEDCYRIAHDMTNRFSSDSLLGFPKEFAERLAVYFPDAVPPKKALARHHETFLRTQAELKAAEERPSDEEKIKALVAALKGLLAHEGEIQTSGIGTEHDSDALEAAKKAANEALALAAK